jgi:hypothetical protein
MIQESGGREKDLEMLFLISKMDLTPFNITSLSSPPPKQPLFHASLPIVKLYYAYLIFI